MSFKGKTVVVTGGTRGIGAAVSSAFLKESARVILTYASQDEGAKAFKAGHQEYSDFFQLKKFDVSSSTAVETFFKELDEADIKIDVLVNNAGIRKDSIVGMLSEEHWDAVLDINLKGSFLMSKCAIQRMSRRKRGRVISITSPSGRIGFAGQGNYAASKAGMVAFSQSLAKEVATRGITVNCVSPGFINTELLSDLTADRVEKYKSLVPAKRFGTPEEVADAVLFLASEKANYITGTVLEVSGGL